jgi:D-serine dehydratase
VVNARHTEAITSNKLIVAMMRWYVDDNWSGDLYMAYSIKSEPQVDSSPVIVGTMNPAVVIAKCGLSVASELTDRLIEKYE